MKYSRTRYDDLQAQVFDHKNQIVQCMHNHNIARLWYKLALYPGLPLAFFAAVEKPARFFMATKKAVSGRPGNKARNKLLPYF